MASFEAGETVVMEVVITDAKTGVKKNPGTSMVVTVTDPDGTVVVNAASMTNDAAGEYHSDYTPGGSAVLGTYQVLYTATDGTRVTRQRDSFEVHG